MRNMTLRNWETSATLSAIAVTVAEFADTIADFNVTFPESDVTKFSSLPRFYCLSGVSATIRTRIQRYMARKDQGGVADSPKMPGLGDPVDSRLECYWSGRQRLFGFPDFDPIRDSKAPSPVSRPACGRSRIQDASGVCPRLGYS
jgi:hypothetical protein